MKHCIEGVKIRIRIGILRKDERKRIGYYSGLGC
jgi:hypothetical protein